MDFGNLYSEYYKAAFRFVKSYVRRADVAEDIVSESIVSVWKQFDSSKGKSFAPFLYTVLRNNTLNYLKAESRHRTELGLEDTWESGDLNLRLETLSESPESIIISDEVRKIIRDTFRSLPERTAEIFRLSRNEGKSYKEIADLYGMSVKGVEYHMGQALKLLREALVDYLPLYALFFFS